MHSAGLDARNFWVTAATVAPKSSKSVPIHWSPCTADTVENGPQPLSMGLIEPLFGGGVPLNCLKKWRTLKLSIDSIVYDNHNWYYKLQTVSRGYIGITPTILVTPPPMNACSPFVLPSTPMFGDWSEIISAGFRPDSFLITTDHMHGKNEACAFPEQGCIPWKKSGVRHGQNRCRWVYTMYIHYGETG